VVLRGNKGEASYLARGDLRVRKNVQDAFQHLHGLIAVLQLQVVVGEEAQVHHACVLAVTLRCTALLFFSVRFTILIC
jgi:hypothetical protein